MRRPHLAILGGGLAGLSVGYFARRAEWPFTIFEAAGRPGGNCITHRYDGFRFDSGAHRFHDKNAGMTRELQVLLGEDLKRIVRPSLICEDNRFLEYPLSPRNILGHIGFSTAVRAAAEIVASRVRPAGPAASFEELAVRKYGRTLGRRFLLGQTEKIWGVPAGRLVPSVAEKRFKEFGMKTLVRQFVPAGNGLAGNGEGTYYYPEGGIGTIGGGMSAACGRERVRYEAFVSRLVHRRGRIRRLEVNHKEIVDAEEIVSTLPLDHLVSILDPRPPRPVRESAMRIRYRNVILAAFFLDRPSVTPAATIYFPDPRFSITRVYEPRNRNPRMSPRGKTALVAEIPCDREGPTWSLSDGLLIERALAELVRARLVDGPEVLAARLRRMDYAYPLLERSLAEEARRIQAYLTGFENLRLSGRSATYQYLWMHELMSAGFELMNEYGARFGL